MAETFTYDNAPEAEVLTEEEQDSLAVGEELMDQQDSLLAGKYKNAQDLESAYLELQKKLGESGDEAPEEEGDMEEAEQFEATPATDMISTASQEFAEAGEITPETRDALAEMSSEELLDAYMSMQKAPSPDLTDSDVSSLKDSVGGEEAYNQITGWAAEALSDADLDRVQRHRRERFDGTDPDGSGWPTSRYQAENGYEGTQLQGKAPSNSRDVFRSQAEVVEAINDPRYDRDPAYRNDILMKLERSDVQF